MFLKLNVDHALVVTVEEVVKYFNMIFQRFSREHKEWHWYSSQDSTKQDTNKDFLVLVDCT
jgi:hypothetical protein